jgi:hypothetical protein
VLKVAHERSLSLDLVELGLGYSKLNNRYLIPKSKLEELAQVFRISVSASKLEDAAISLGYQV